MEKSRAMRYGIVPAALMLSSCISLAPDEPEELDNDCYLQEIVEMPVFKDEIEVILLAQEEIISNANFENCSA